MNSKIINADAHLALDTIDSKSIDACIFSPPYDNLRTYDGYSFDMHKLGMQLYRVLKVGAVCVMVIQDQTINGFKSLTSYETAVDWRNNIGFDMFDTLIYKRHGIPGKFRAFRTDHENMFVFSKGLPKHIDKSQISIPCTSKANSVTHVYNRDRHGNRKKVYREGIIKDRKCPGTIWQISADNQKGDIKHKHPATFPIEIPLRLIKCFTVEGNIVLDPMCGSGTTCVAAYSLLRRYIGIDSNVDYCLMAEEKIKKCQVNLKLWN